MEVITLEIDKIKPYENNAKEHPKEQIEQIKKSIIEYGNNDPIAVDGNGVIIEGHGRYIALKELGYNECEVIRLFHLSEEQKRAYRLIHNKLTMNSDFDFEKLEAEIAELSEMDMSQFGFEESVFTHIEDLINSEGISYEFKTEKETFNITFVFPIGKKDVIDAYVKHNGKEYITNKIIEAAEGTNVD